jgi:hypothetical protein
MKKIVLSLLAFLFLITGFVMQILNPWDAWWWSAAGILLSATGLNILLDRLRGRLVDPAPAYRYRAQELGIIFRGPPR